MIQHPSDASLPAPGATVRVGTRRVVRPARNGVARGQEHYHALLRNLRMPARAGSGPRAVGVTRTIGSDPSTVVALNLALTLAGQVSDTVLLVAANPLNRVIRETLVSQAKRDVINLYHVLQEERTLSEAVLGTDSDNLFVLPSECSKKHEGVLPGIQRFANLLEDMRQNYSYVIVDLPIASELTPCFDLAAELDGVLLEVDANRSRVRAARTAVQQMKHIGINVLGCVFKES